MKQKVLAVCLSLGLVLGANLAMAKDEKAPTPQQSKMATCSKDAKEKALKGDERKAFMKTCLSNKPAEEKKEMTPQQEKMQSCNKEAKEKNIKGSERRAFMSSCLKGNAKPPEAKPAEAKPAETKPSDKK